MKPGIARDRVVLPALFIAFAALAVLCKLPVWMDPTHTYGGSGDAQQTMWFVSWPPFALTHQQNPLLSSYLNYPAGFNMLWNTTMPGPAVLLWPVTALWGAVATYNVITTAAIALSAFFALLAIRRFVPSTLAAAVGGLLYGFSPAMMAQQLGHAQVVFSAVTIPLALLALDELLIRQRLRPWLLGVLIAVLGVFQFLVFQEFFVTELIVGFIVSLILALAYRHQLAARLPYAARTLAVAGVIGAAALAYPVIAVQLGGPERVHGAIHSADIYSTSPLNLVIPEGSEWLTPSWVSTLNSRFSGNASEADGYIGLPLLVLGLVVLVRFWRDPLVRTVSLSCIVVTVLSFGPHLTPLRRSLFPMPWYPFSRVPLIGNVLPSRMMYFVFLGLGILLAYALIAVWRWRRGFWAPLAVAAVVLLPLFPRVPLFSQTLPSSLYFSTSAVSELPAGAVAYTMPFSSPLAVDPMNWQRESGMRFKLIGGYVLGPAAAGQDALKSVAGIFSTNGSPTISAALASSFADELQRDGVGIVIVGPVAQQAAAVQFCTAMLGMPPRIRDGYDVWVLRQAAAR